MQALGRWSYSIYLLHIPVLLAANAVFGEARVEGNAGLKLGIVAVVLALSGLAYRFIEAPLMRLGQRLSRRGGGARASAAA
jgi:peptidoglycan/LPS O-acetylase OafA/YrhL